MKLSLKYSVEGKKEVGLGDVVAQKLLDFPTVRLL